MKKILAIVLLTATALFLGTVIIKSAFSEEHKVAKNTFKSDPFALENIKELKTDPVSMINFLRQDKKKYLAFLKKVEILRLRGILNEEVSDKNSFMTTNYLLMIEAMLEKY